MTTPFEAYIVNIENDYRGGKATEYTYRSALETFMEALERGIEASNDPKHIECGAPDFVVERRKVPLGYVETKDVGEALDRIEKSEQMKRYLKALHNLILTDYVEFRWYLNGEKKRTIRLAEMGKNKHLAVNPQAEQNIIQMFGDFYATETPTVRTPKELAGRLAGVTHFIRDRIVEVLKSGEPSLQKSFDTRFKAFKDLLLPALKEEEFADLYAQTMTYCLFAAKLSAPEGTNFTLLGAYQYLFGNKFLRRLFSDVSEELDEIEIIRPYLLDIVSLLNRADFHGSLANFGKRTRTEDPVVHFYETFLAAYDPKMRESRGVYYTPEPVVQFIVNSVDHLLKSRFDRPWGLADPNVKVLDPATGTGTFLYYVVQKIYEEVNDRKQTGQWKQKSKELLNRIFGFELLIAPYVVSHLKLGLLLKTLGAPLEGRDERLQIYMTNTLEEGVTRAEQLVGLGHYIAEEASDAAFVKKQQEIMVVLGNPPYSGRSANSSVDKDGNLNFIGKLLREYYFVDGAPLGEKNPKWLQDDYVKFIRFGEWRIDKTGHGILAFITNHGYLDNPTFRGMRQHLMNTFDEIYILDLHGHSKKKEKAPDGGKDENVFDIQQGVAIFLAVRHQASNSPKSSQVYHADLWGLREQKYAALQKGDLSNIEWNELKPEKPSYYFRPQDRYILDEYNLGWHLSDVFLVSSVGIVTGQDEQTIGFTVEETKTLATKHGIDKSKITPILYRSFDQRYVVYDKMVIVRPRLEVMVHMLSGKNFGLIATRQTRDKWEVLTTEHICGHKSCAAYDINSLFPLYLYTTAEATAGTLFAQQETTRKPNISSAFIDAFCQKLDMQFIQDGGGDLVNTFGPEDVFYYIYSIFYSPTYRTRYIEFLKIDYPRVPLISDQKIFARLVLKGKELSGLHLLKSSKIDDFITTYPEAGNNKVERVSYADGRVYINDQQYFGDVPEQLWRFKVGGYQVCDKWLKDRKGRILSSEDIDRYQRVIVSLKETIRLMEEVDKLIDHWPII